jgi:hypothetical protein
MKKIIRLTESDLHRIIKNSVKRILREGVGDNVDNYDINHIKHGYHRLPDGGFDNTAYDYDEALDANTPEEFDRIMKDRQRHIDTAGHVGMFNHPQATPYNHSYYPDSDKLESFDARNYPDGGIDLDATYDKKHATYGNHSLPNGEFDGVAYDYDKALDANTPEEFDELMKRREYFSRLSADNAMYDHNQAIPPYSHNKESDNAGRYVENGLDYIRNRYGRNGQ